jgi:hypothetical protein
MAGLPGEFANLAPESWRDDESKRLPRPKEIEKYIASYTGPFREPENIWEKRAQWIGERVPEAAYLKWLRALQYAARPWQTGSQ